jgi:chromosome segregation ATPase
MVTIRLRTIALIAIGLALPASAYANGRVDDARQLYFSDIMDAYDESVEYLEDSNTIDGAAAIKELHQLVGQLLAYSTQIQSDSAALAPSLAEVWSSTHQEITQFKSEAELLERQVGREQYRLDNLKARFAGTGSAMERSHANMQGFGQRFVGMNARIEDLSELYSGEITDSYEETMEYLEAYNTTDGAVEIAELHQLTDKLQAISVQVLQDATALSPTLFEIWKQADGNIGRLTSSAGGIKMMVGRGALPLDTLRSAFEAVGSGLEDASEEIQEFGERFKVICDTCF